MIRHAVEFLNFLDSIKQCSCRKIQVSNIFGDIVRNTEKLTVNAILATYYVSQGTVFWVYELHDIRLEISNAIRSHPCLASLIVVLLETSESLDKKSLAGVSVMLPSNPGYLLE